MELLAWRVRASTIIVQAPHRPEPGRAQEAAIGAIPDAIQASAATPIAGRLSVLAAGRTVVVRLFVMAPELEAHC